MSEEELLKMYGGESNIFKLLLVELKEGTFSDCDEEFQYCCYKVITNLQQELTKYKEKCKKVVGYINNYDVFAEFSFPLMKRDEENQVKTSIQYEFDTSIKKDLLEILEDKEEE